MRILKVAISFFFVCFFQVGKAQDTLAKTFLPSNNLTIAGLEARIRDLEKQAESDEDSRLLQDIQIGLSFGFNFFINGEQQYYIKQDSTIGLYGQKNGISGMLSALVGYKINPKNAVLLNVPLGDLSGNPNQAIGIFNKKVAGGLGYGYNVSDLSFILVVNIFPYEKLAVEIVQHRKFEQEPYTIANLEDLPTTTAYSPSITVGVCYSFVRPSTIGY